jgi:predicted aspartyl protease
LSRSLTKKEPELLDCGAVVNVYLCVNRVREEALIAAKKRVPDPVESRAMVDTGASMSCVPASRAGQLGLSPHRFIVVTSFDGRKERYPVYRIKIGIHGIDGAVFEVNAVGTSTFAEGAECVIGREILEGSRFVYDGRGGQFTLDFES